MPSTVSANSRSVVHKGSNDPHIVAPDVCKTPAVPSPVPIPYPNLGMSTDTSNGAVTVTVEGQMPMVQSAIYTRTSGDNAGSVGGVLSGTVMGVAEFMLYSFDVTFEGKGVCRVGDPMFHNNKNAVG